MTNILKFTKNKGEVKFNIGDRLILNITDEKCTSGKGNDLEGPQVVSLLDHWSNHILGNITISFESSDKKGLPPALLVEPCGNIYLYGKSVKMGGISFGNNNISGELFYIKFLLALKKSFQLPIYQDLEAGE